MGGRIRICVLFVTNLLSAMNLTILTSRVYLKIVS